MKKSHFIFKTFLYAEKKLGNLHGKKVFLEMIFKYTKYLELQPISLEGNIFTLLLSLSKNQSVKFSSYIKWYLSMLQVSEVGRKFTLLQMGTRKLLHFWRYHLFDKTFHMTALGGTFHKFIKIILCSDIYKKDYTFIWYVNYLFPKHVTWWVRLL